MTKSIKTNFSKDNKKVTVEVDGSFSAAELQSLITKLALVRNKMEPEVPRNFSSQIAPELETDILTEDSPDLEMSCNPGSDRIRFKIRNRGIGWLIFEIPYDTAVGIRDFLISQTSDPNDATPNFLTADFDNGARSH